MYISFDGAASVDLQVLWRENSDDPWKLVEREETDILHESGKFFVRARIHHFSDDCLAKSVNMQSPYDEQVVRWKKWGKPRRRQIQFLNATDKVISLLALPTGFSNRIASSFKVGLYSSEIGINMEINRAAHQAVLSEAVSAQMIQLPIRDGTEPPRGGDQCPSQCFSLSEWTKNEARVALITADEKTVEVWDYRTIKGGTRIAVLPKQFSHGMRPLLGISQRCDLPGLSDYEVALTAVGRAALMQKGINTVLSEVRTTRAVEAEPQDE